MKYYTFDELTWNLLEPELKEKLERICNIVEPKVIDTDVIQDILDNNYAFYKGVNEAELSSCEEIVQLFTEQSIISEIKSKEFKKCGIGDNVCNCKEEKDCGYL